MVDYLIICLLVDLALAFGFASSTGIDSTLVVSVQTYAVGLFLLVHMKAFLLSVSVLC